MPFAKARWIDQNGRSHNWSGEVASSDRNQVKSQIYAQTGAKDVIIGSVGEDPSIYEQKRQQKMQEERDRFSAQEERLRSGNSNVTNSSSYSSSSSSNSGSSMDIGSAGGLVLLLGAVWAFVTFMPWILMLTGGAAGAWVTEKITGQTVEEYTQENYPTDQQSTKALITLLVSLILGGIGFVQGSHWQHELNKDTNTNQQPKVEQVRQK